MTTSSNTTRKSPNPWWVGVICGMASYIDSASIVGTGIALVIYQMAIGITLEEFGLASSALTACIAIGAIVGGRLGDAFGRRTVFLCTMAMITIGALLATFAGGFIPLLIGIILIGLGTGADLPVSLSTISESSTDANRGSLIGLSNILWLVGIISAIAISMFTGDLGRIGAQLLFGQVAVVAALVMIARFTIPETESWLKAREERRAGIKSTAAANASVWSLFRTPWRTPFIALLVFYGLTNVAANTQGQFTTFIWVNIVGQPVSFASTIGLFVFPPAILLGIWFMRIVDGPHRMTYYAVGAVALTASFLIPAIFGFSTPAMITFMILNAIGGAFAFEGMMKVWTQESFPTLLRTTAQGSVLFVGRLTAALVAAITPMLLATVPRGFYGGLGVAVGIAMILGWVVFKNARSQFSVEDEPVALAQPVQE